MLSHLPRAGSPREPPSRGMHPPFGVGRASEALRPAVLVDSARRTLWLPHDERTGRTAGRDSGGWQGSRSAARMLRKGQGDHSALAVRQDAMVRSARTLKPLWEKEKERLISDCEVSAQLLNLLKVCGLASFTALASFGSGESRNGLRPIRPDFLPRLVATIDESLALEFEVASEAVGASPEDFLKGLEVDMVIRASLKVGRSENDASVADSPRRLHSYLVGGSSGGLAQCLHACAKQAICFAAAHTAAGDEAESPMRTANLQNTVMMPGPMTMAAPTPTAAVHRHALNSVGKEHSPSEAETRPSPANQPVNPQALYNSAASIVEQSVASKTVPPNIRHFVTSWAWGVDHSVNVAPVNLTRGNYDIRYKCKCQNEIRLQQAPENRNRVNGRAIKRHWLGTSPTAGPSCTAIREYLQRCKKNPISPGLEGPPEVDQSP